MTRGETAPAAADAAVREPVPDVAPAPGTRRQIYGRRAGPRMRPARKRALGEGLAALGVALPEAGGPVDPRALFPAPVAEVWLEVGFGGGEHLAELAARHPGVGFLGVEPFVAGVGKLMAACAARGLGNVRVVVDDARLLLAALPDAAIARAFVLFPDPWPKARHQKRRIVNPATAAAFGRVLAPGGRLRAATDDPGYARAMLAALLARPELAWTARRERDWLGRPADAPPPTRYEAKALAAGRAPVWLEFERRRDFVGAA